MMREFRLFVYPSGDTSVYCTVLPLSLLLLISPGFCQTPKTNHGIENPSMLGSFLDAGMPDEVLFAVRKPSIDGHELRRNALHL